MRSKPDPVDQPKRDAHYDCAILKCYRILSYCTETVLLMVSFRVCYELGLGTGLGFMGWIGFKQI